eukprot:293153-Chlamydomonas_euryale.AAC.1
MMIKFNISWNNGEPGQGGGGNLGPCEMTRMIMIMVPPLIITPCYAQRIAARPMVAMQHWAGHSLLRGGRGDVPSARALRRSYFKTKGAVCVGHACSHGLGVPGCPREDPPPLGSSRLALILIVLMSAKYQGVTWTTPPVAAASSPRTHTQLPFPAANTAPLIATCSPSRRRYVEMGGATPASPS